MNSSSSLSSVEIKIVVTDGVSSSIINTFTFNNYVENITEEIGLNNISKDTPQPSHKIKKSIFERLSKNRSDALEQQKNQKSQGFEIKYHDVLETLNVETIYKKKQNISFDALKFDVNGREVVHASTLGCRENMEDDFLVTHQSFMIQEREIFYELLGIFDGHNGNMASRFVKNNIAGHLKKALETYNSEGLTDEGIFKALKAGFISLNNDLIESESGTTAAVAIKLEGKIWIANTGDSRTLFVTPGETTQASEDAKPDNPRYERKITEFNGNKNCVSNGRIRGMLNVGRALGDKDIISWNTLKCLVYPNPKITCYSLGECKGAYLVLACDGLYEKASSNEIGNAIIGMSNQNDSLESMAKKLIFNAVMSGSYDNISVILTKL